MTEVSLQMIQTNVAANAEVHNVLWSKTGLHELQINLCFIKFVLIFRLNLPLVIQKLPCFVELTVLCKKYKYIYISHLGLNKWKIYIFVLWTLNILLALYHIAKFKLNKPKANL